MKKVLILVMLLSSMTAMGAEVILNGGIDPYRNVTAKPQGDERADIGVSIGVEGLIVNGKFKYGVGVEGRTKFMNDKAGWDNFYSTPVYAVAKYSFWNDFYVLGRLGKVINTKTNISERTGDYFSFGLGKSIGNFDIEVVHEASETLDIGSGSNLKTPVDLFKDGNAEVISLKVGYAFGRNKDVTGPEITLNSKKEGNSAEWTYGVNEKGAKIKEVKLNGQNVPVEKNGTYSAKNLAEGENTLEVTAEDKEGNITKKTNTVLIDTKAPELTVSSKVNGNSSEWTYATDKDSKIKEVKLNGQNVPVSADGKYNVQGLAEGENKLEVTAEDEAGNITKKTNTVLIDTKGPELTVSSKVNGNSSEWTYATEKNAKIKEVKLNGKNVPVSADGKYSAKNLAEGENTLEVTAEDEAGNIIKKTNTVLIDTKGPELTVNSKVNGNSAEWTYVTEKDAKIKEVKLNGKNVPVSADGKYNAQGLAEGENKLEVTAEDKAGNIAKKTNTAVVNTKGPELTLNSKKEGNDVVWTYATDKNSKIKEVKLNGKNVPVSADGKYNAQGLAEGENTLEVTAENTTGNVTKKTNTVLIDTKGPELFLNSTVENKSATWTYGVTEKDAKVTDVRLNGGTVTVSEAGKYVGTNLKAGENTLEVTAEDKEGNVTKKTNTVQIKDSEIEAFAKEGKSLPLIVGYGTNVTDLTAEQKQRLENAVKALEGQKGTLSILGYTDNTGSDSINKKLSKQRADAVAEMVKKIMGNNKDIKIETIGKGKTNFKYPNDTEANRKLNRRIEFEFKADSGEVLKSE